MTPSGISIAATAVDMNAHLPMVCNWLPDANVTALSDVQSLNIFSGSALTAAGTVTFCNCVLPLNAASMRVTGI